MRNKDLDIETVLSPAYLEIWGNSLLGVMVLDKKGLVLYVNKLLAKTDDLLDVDIIGKPLEDFFPIERSDHLSIQALTSGKPIIKKNVVYYTHKNKLVNSLCSNFPLYSRGRIEGVIHFALNLVTSQNLLLRHTPRNIKNASQYLESEKYTFNSIIGNSTALNNAITYAKANSQTDFSALIWAETGCGKELFAQSMHNDSARAHEPFIAINCAAIPENLLETTLFGTAKGAFTGAVENAGLIEKAEGGTLLFDELNSMSLEMQAKLLRVIQEKKVRRVGAHEEQPFNVKFISTCNIHPAQALDESIIRLDLFYRLAVVVIEIPSLKERKSDIPLLCKHFLTKWAFLPSHKHLKISDEVYSIFDTHSWPGNVRELEHTLKSCLTSLKSGKIIYRKHLSSYFLDNYENSQENDAQSEASSVKSKNEDNVYPRKKVDSFSQGKMCLKSAVAAFEKENIEIALTRSGYNISKAGRMLGLSPQSLKYKIGKLSIKIVVE